MIQQNEINLRRHNNLGGYSPFEKAKPTTDDVTRHQDFRAKALEAAKVQYEACKIPGVYGGVGIQTIAQRFYSYIMKGE